MPILSEARTCPYDLHMIVFKEGPSCLRQVHPDAAVRDAATSCYLRVAHYQSKLYLDRDLYVIIATVAELPAADSLAQRRYQKLLRAFVDSGIGLCVRSVRSASVAVCVATTHMGPP